MDSHCSDLEPGVFRQVYLDFPGTSIAHLELNPRYPDSPHLEMVLPSVFEAPTNYAENYGQCLQALVIPPLTGEYTFWIAADDQGELHLSTDTSPDNLRLIAHLPPWATPREWDVYPSQESAPILLEAGTPYLIRALMKESMGGDNLAVGWRLPDGTLERPIPVYSGDVPQLFVTGMVAPQIVSEPADAKIEEGQPAIFEVEVLLEFRMTYQWERDGVAIEGATHSILYLPKISWEADGARFRCVLDNGVGTFTTRESVLKVTPDVTLPRLTHVAQLGEPHRIELVFSEPIDPITATDPTNYNFDPPLRVQSATPDPHGFRILLDVEEPPIRTLYSLSLRNILDQAREPNLVASDVSFEFVTNPEPGILRDIFLGITGTGLANLTSAPHFPHSPDETGTLTEFFEVPFPGDGHHDHYGQRLRAILLPPITGEYTFWITADDRAELYLGLEDSPDIPQQIASTPLWTEPDGWDEYYQQESAPIHLTAGRFHHIEVLMKESIGRDHVAVGWRLPDGTLERPMAVQSEGITRLFVDGLNPPIITRQPDDQLIHHNHPATFDFGVDRTIGLSFQWERDHVPLTGQTNASLHLPRATMEDYGSVFRCVLVNEYGTATTRDARLVVFPPPISPDLADDPPPLFINEVLLLNTSTDFEVDDDGQDQDRPADWFEIYNPNVYPVDLAGFYLSDDTDQPLKHQIPGGTTNTVVHPMSFLVIQASGNPELGPLHTNFRLSHQGETITLTAPDTQTTIDSIFPDPRRPELSYGRTTDGSATWSHFIQSTPAASNNTSTPYDDILVPPAFSHEGGFYEQAFHLAISSPDPDAVIYYTLDGSEPDPDNLEGRTFAYKNQYPCDPGDPVGPFLEESYRTHLYEGPIPIMTRDSDPNRVSVKSSIFQVSHESHIPKEPVFKGTPVRAIAVKPGAVASRIATTTYFIHPSGSSLYDLPVVSITLPEKDLFGWDNGIYCAGRVFEEWRASRPIHPINGGRPANWYLRGPRTEVAASFELFTSEGPVIRQNVGTRIHGGWSRSNPRKALRLYARPQYDDQDSFNYPIFGDLPARGDVQNPVTRFNRLLIRSSGNDHYHSLYRDAFMQDLVKHWPFDVQGSRAVVHFINGEYWGIMNIRERMDTHYLAAHYDVDPDDIAILTMDAQISTGIEADQTDFLDIVNYALENDPTDPDHLAWIEQRVDLENLAHYFAAQVYFTNTDWPHNNIDFWRLRTGVPESGRPRGHDGRWRWMLYDTDFGFNMYGNGGQGHNTLPRLFDAVDATSILFQCLMQNDSFEAAFINAMADGLNSCFLPQHVLSVIQRFHDTLEAARPEHIARWNSGDYDINSLRGFANGRPSSLRTHIRFQFDIPDNIDLTVAPPPEGGGRIQVNNLLIDSDLVGHPTPDTPYPWTGTYFQNVPVTLRAIPDPGHRFVRWSGIESPASLEPIVSFLIEPDQIVTAVFETEPVRIPIHSWDFNAPDSLLTPTLTLTTPNATIEVLTDIEAEVVAGSGQGFNDGHLRINQPLGTSIHIHLPTTGFEQVVLSYDSRRSGQGAGIQQLSYTFDGENFVDWPTPITVLDTSPQLFTIDFSSLPDADDNPLFAVRITFDQGFGGIAGNNRFDNLTLRGVPLPETNLPPFISNPLPPLLSVVEQGPTVQIDLNHHFADPNDDPLTFNVEIDTSSTASASIADNQLSIAGLVRGDAIVHLSVSDGLHPSISTSFRLLIHPAPVVPPFAFTAWDPQTPERVYPAHMLFLQTDTIDTDLNSPLEFAYDIPHDDYSPADTPGFPYNNSQRTRINGLGSDGISFINTGRDRDLGGALLAIDTRNKERIQIQWLAATLTPNERSYALRLQYRVGIEAPFTNLLDASDNPVEYIRSESQGHTATIGPVELPSDALDQPYVQLLWRYYKLSGDSGPRDELRLDDIHISADTLPFVSYEAWRSMAFPDPEDRGDDLISGPLADGGTGYSNLLRYGLGSMTESEVLERLPQLIRVDNSAAIHFGFNDQATDLAALLIASDNLLDWDIVLWDSLTHPLPSLDGSLRFIIDPDPITDTAARFYRLQFVLE